MIAGPAAPSSLSARATRLWLLLAAASRAWAGLDPLPLHPDVWGQALDPAFAGLGGGGELAWEFEAGLRSWLWPGLFAVPAALAEVTGAPWPDVGMLPWIAACRMIAVAIDLATLRLAMALAVRRGGAVAGHAVALAATTAPAWVQMGSQALIDLPASCLLLATCLAADRTTERPAERSDWAALGGAAAAVTLLRPQWAPAAAAVLVWHAWKMREVVGEAREGWLAALGGAAAVATLYGVVDAITWGSPFASLANYLRYQARGGAAAQGAMPLDAYLRLGARALPWVGLPLLAAALVGARRAPTLAMAATAGWLAHHAVPLKVWRFVHPGLWLVLVLAAVGVARLGEGLAVQRRRPAGLALVIGWLAAAAFAWRGGGLWPTTWIWAMGGAEGVVRSRGVAGAWITLSATHPRPRSILQLAVPAGAAPGRALLGLDAAVRHRAGAPLLRSDFDDADAWVLAAVDLPAVAHLHSHRCQVDAATAIALCLRRGGPHAGASGGRRALGQRREALAQPGPRAVQAHPHSARGHADVGADLRRGPALGLSE